ncbi:MAG: glycosyltransferase family 39 protein, partial [Bacteroidota bacterium]
MTLPSWILDSDEITYAVMADHWLNGSVLYRDIIDIKPPGIFMIFALIQIVFGKSMLAIRLITIGVVAGSAYFLYRTKRQIGFSFESALISSIAFILMFNFYFGFASNAEVFFIFTTSLGVHIFFRARSSIDYFLTGIIFGIGFCIKQLILFDLAALGLFFFMTSLKSGDLEQKVVPMALIVLGFLIPFGLAHLTFWAAGHFDGYYFVTYVAPGNYMSERTWQDTVTFLSKGILVYLPFILL